MYAKIVIKIFNRRWQLLSGTHTTLPNQINNISQTKVPTIEIT